MMFKNFNMRRKVNCHHLSWHNDDNYTCRCNQAAEMIMMFIFSDERQFFQLSIDESQFITYTLQSLYNTKLC